MVEREIVCVFELGDGGGNGRGPVTYSSPHLDHRGRQGIDCRPKRGGSDTNESTRKLFSSSKTISSLSSRQTSNRELQRDTGKGNGKASCGCVLWQGHRTGSCQHNSPWLTVMSYPVEMTPREPPPSIDHEKLQDGRDQIRMYPPPTIQLAPTSNAHEGRWTRMSKGMSVTYCGFSSLHHTTAPLHHTHRGAAHRHRATLTGSPLCSTAPRCAC